jgi:hypothetical protein
MLSYTPSVLPAPVKPMPFGSGKHRKREKTIEMAQRLEAAGITPKAMADEWDVVLWKAREKDKGIRITVDSSRNPRVDLKALRRWLEEKLGSRVDLRDEKIKKSCCGSGCTGCLNGNPATRKNWTG